MYRILIAMMIAVTAAGCSYKSETVKASPPATTTVTPAASTTYVTPTGSTTVTSPAPAASTTVTTTR